jgi:hypothetical protein
MDNTSSSNKNSSLNRRCARLGCNNVGIAFLKLRTSQQIAGWFCDNCSAELIHDGLLEEHYRRSSSSIVSSNDGNTRWALQMSESVRGRGVRKEKEEGGRK